MVVGCLTLHSEVGGCPTKSVLNATTKVPQSLPLRSITVFVLLPEILRIEFWRSKFQGTLKKFKKHLTFIQGTFKKGTLKTVENHLRPLVKTIELF